jgi:hypothetical protein
MKNLETYDVKHQNPKLIQNVTYLRNYDICTDTEIGSDTVFAADAEIDSDAVFAADFSMNSDAELGGRGKTDFR